MTPPRPADSLGSVERLSPNRCCEEWGCASKYAGRNDCEAFQCAVTRSILNDAAHAPADAVRALVGLRDQWAKRETDLIDLSDDDCSEICGDVVADLDAVIAALSAAPAGEVTFPVTHEWATEAAPQPARAASLPPLPEPDHMCGDGWPEQHFTEAQMQAYATEAARLAQPVGGEVTVMVDRMVAAYQRTPGWSCLNAEAQRNKARAYLTAALPPAAPEGRDGCATHGKAAVESLTLYGCGCSVHESNGGTNRITAPAAAPLAGQGDANVERVRAKLRERAAVGLRKYGVTTERGDLSPADWLRHLQEELMDATVYIEAHIAHHGARTGESN